MRPGLILLILLCLLAAPLHAVENPLALLAGENTRLEVVMSDGPEGLADNVRAHVGSLQDKDADALARYRRRAEHLAQQALQALGYYEAQVRSELVGEGGDARLRLHIEPGTPVRLRSVDIRVTGEAAQMPGFISPDGPQLQPGAVLSHGAYDDARKLIGNQALRYGFFAGRFLQRDLLIDPPEQAADIHLHWDSGPRYRFGAVEFSGNPPVSADLLQRLQPIRAGEPYHSDRLGELSRALQASGYFQDIQLDASPEQAEGSQLPVRVKLTARDPRSLAAGAGYSTDVGARLRGSFTRHWLGEEGHSWGSEFELSAPRQNLTAWYQIPLDPPLTDSLRFTSGYQHEDLVDTRSTRWTLGTQWQHQTASDWQRVLSLRLEQERYTLADEDGNSSLLLPGIAFSRTRSDSKVDPHEGWSLQLELSGASRGLISDANLLWGRARGKYLTTFAGGHRLLARAELGSIATDDFSAIPPSLRFFTGGDQSVRGFDYQTLSPLDSTGERVGGRNLVVGSLEYQYPLREKWRLATFVDQGNAIDSPRDPLRTGVGFGVRWVSPVGPLRLDIARGLTDSYGEGGWRIHFSMGPEL